MSTEATLPRDAAEALALWDKGEAIAAVQVEQYRATQAQIYAVGFEMIRSGRMVNGKPQLDRSIGAAELSQRERDVAHSIAYVAMLNGWASMVAAHLASGHIKAITISNPSPKETKK